MINKPDVNWQASPNYTPGRQDQTLSMIIDHHTAGSAQSATAEFLDGSTQRSAHYLVALDGSITQFVNDSDTAWHAGTMPANLQSIGIEHENAGDAAAGQDTYSDALYVATTQLQAWLCLTNGLDPSSIFPHSQFVPTACPGTLDLARIRAGVKAVLSAPKPGAILTMGRYLKLRTIRAAGSIPATAEWDKVHSGAPGRATTGDVLSFLPWGSQVAVLYEGYAQVPSYEGQSNLADLCAWGPWACYVNQSDWIPEA